MDSASDSAPIWNLMLSEAKRSVDHQIRALEELDDKIEHMMTIGASAVALGIALGAIVLQSAAISPPPLFWGLLGLSVMADVSAIAVLYAAYAGIFRKHEIHVGPRPDTWVKRMGDDAWGGPSFFRGMLTSLPRYFEFNARVMRKKLRQRDIGVYLLFGSLAPLILAAFFIGV